MSNTTYTNNPTAAQYGAMQNFRGVGQNQVQYGLDGFLFASGLPEGHMEKTIIHQFWNNRGMFHLHALFSMLGDATRKPVGSSAVEWREMGKARIGEEVATTTTATTATVTVELETEETRVFEGMILKSARGFSVRIESVTAGSTGNNTEITVRKTDGTNFASGDFTDGDILGINHTRFGEGSSAPSGQRWYPENKYNYLTILRRSAEWTGSNASERVEVELPGGGTAWVPYTVRQTLIELLKDIENVYMFGEEKSTETNDGLSTRGLDTDIFANANNQVTYTTMTETTIQNLLTGQNDYSNTMEYHLMYGLGFGTDLHNVMKQYTIDGMTNRGVFTGKEGIAAGFGIQSYSFFGYLCHLHHYRQFDNTDEMGNAGAASATVTNYSDYALLVSANQESGSFMTGQQGYGKSMPGVCLLYKQNGNVNRGFTYGIENGITGEFVGGDPNALNPQASYQSMNHMVATGDDATKIHFLSEVGIMATNVENAHALCRKNG